ncbi:hypothetical protein RQP53_09405 [Paucibacter sp. APW11]|uniref:Uncharacterized protein n=1 Tax=Roseateles aquae TaxID=3077235 RepID=A0ABU3PA77_9BURK|nr:hypothetical protein [Paucibacter sp. APW11]MDT8999481.1 hypothetical protein [Paucibacter sp. APW11]
MTHPPAPSSPDSKQARPQDSAAPAQPVAGPRRAKAPLSAPDLPLPHERDESTEPVLASPDPVIVQAKRDIDAGQVDTDMRATPGLDAGLRASLVPGPGGKPSPGC